MKLISICVPMYNEGENINAFYKQINQTLTPLYEKYNFEFLFINAGSMDDRLSKVRELKKQERYNRLKEFTSITLHSTFIGLLSEYLGKIFMESKGNPLYFVQTYNDEEETDEKNF